MERNYLNLGRPPSKLRYFTHFESYRRSGQKSKGVVRNIEDYLDELDSSLDGGSELALSPLSEAETLKPETALKENLEARLGSSERLNPDEEKLFKEQGVLKTSSPVGMVMNEADGDEVEDTSLLLYDEKSDEDGWESPPTKFVLANRWRVGARSSQRQSDEELMPLQSKQLDDATTSPCRPSAEDGGNAPGTGKGKAPTLARQVLLSGPQKDRSDSPVSGDKSCPVAREGSAFLIRLKDSIRPKETCFRKGASVTAPSRDEPVEDFVILENEDSESPPWFSIPRKTRVKESKPARQHVRDTAESDVLTEGGTAGTFASEGQEGKGKRRRRKKAEGQGSGQAGAVNQSTQANRRGDVPVTVPSEAKRRSDTQLALGKVGGARKRRAPRKAVEQKAAPVPLAEKEDQSRANKKQRKVKEMQCNRSSPVTWTGSVNQMLDEEEQGKRIRVKPGAWWLVSQDENGGEANPLKRSHNTIQRSKVKKIHKAGRGQALSSAVGHQAPNDPVPVSSRRKNPRKRSKPSPDASVDQSTKAKSRRTHRSGSRGLSEPLQRVRGVEEGVSFSVTPRNPALQEFQQPEDEKLQDWKSARPGKLCQRKPSGDSQGFGEGCPEGFHSLKSPGGLRVRPLPKSSRKTRSEVQNSPKTCARTQQPLWRRKLLTPQKVRASLSSSGVSPFSTASEGPFLPPEGRFTAPRHREIPLQAGNSPDTLYSSRVRTVKRRTVTAGDCGGRYPTEQPCEASYGDLKCGPSSVIDHNYQDEFSPSPETISNRMWESEMCRPPLSPISLQVEDRANLVKWLRDLWHTADGAPVITPEHFRWYEFHGRAIGFRTDLLHETFSTGKILLGSYMKKPLQVDSNAVSVYNVLTSSLAVRISGVEKTLFSGHTFMVPSGHAYELQNLTSEPAVLLYHRMLSESDALC